jgi:hypothetical protein
MSRVHVSYTLECADEDVDDVVDQITDWYTADASSQTQEGIDYQILPDSVVVRSDSE